MEILVPVRTCPRCHGVGELDQPNLTPKKREVSLCPNCRGLRMVPQLTCRGCGRAALFSDPIYYCGRLECWTKIVEVVDVNKKPEAKTGFSPFQVMGPSQRISDVWGRRQRETYHKDMTDAEWQEYLSQRMGCC